MKNVAVIGLGVMGLPIAKNLVAKGLEVQGADLSEEAQTALTNAGGKGVAPEELNLEQCDVIITMLPEGQHVKTVYEAIVLKNAKPGSLLVDCSTIDVETTRSLAAKAADHGLLMVDSPVSGGPEAAESGKLSFMIGGNDEAIAQAMPLLNQMGAKVQQFGPIGSGQAAKACHNMICGITAIAVCEGFALADALGLDADKFYSLCSGAAAQSWVLENRCPIPGVVSEAPSSHDYNPGFAAGLLAKDLRLAQMAAETSGQATPFGAEAAKAFTEFSGAGGANKDFSAYFTQIANQS